MKARKIIIIGGLAVAGYFLLKFIAARTIAKISYAAGGFRVHKVTLSGIELRVGMTVTNESDIPAPISAFIGRLIYNWPNGSPSVLGELKLVQAKQLPGFGQTDLEFSMTTGLVGGAYEILNILTNGNPLDLSKINYANIDVKRFQIQGTLKVGELPVDIKTNLVS